MISNLGNAAITIILVVKFYTIVLLLYVLFKKLGRHEREIAELKMSLSEYSTESVKNPKDDSITFHIQDSNSGISWH